MKNLNSLPCDFLDNDDTTCVSLLRDQVMSSVVNHTEFLIARQLLLQRIYDRVQYTVDRLLRSDSVQLLYPAGSIVAQVANYESLLSSDADHE